MTTWHQQRRPGKLYHDTQWTIVTNPPGDLCTLWLEPTEQQAKERLAIWAANGRNVQHCYILKPVKQQLFFRQPEDSPLVAPDRDLRVEPG